MNNNGRMKKKHDDSATHEETFRRWNIVFLDKIDMIRALQWSAEIKSNLKGGFKFASAEMLNTFWSSQIWNTK